jgi:hypothetical protein
MMTIYAAIRPRVPGFTGGNPAGTSMVRVSPSRQ